MARDERQPLLQQASKSTKRGLRWSQIIILGTWKATHSLYFGYILTWITRFIVDNKLADYEHVGQIAGWIESSYSFGVLLGLAPASYISDRIGRKPTAIIGILLASIGTIGFGFAKTVPQLMLIRTFNGAFTAFLPATVLTMLIELSDEESLPLAYTINSSCWTIGMLIAPNVGGYLAEPALHWPEFFKDTIWERYPFALSGVAAAAMPLLSTLAALIVLEETLPSEKRRSMFGLCKRNEMNDTAEIEDKPLPLRKLFTKPVCYMLFMWSFFVFMQLTGMVGEVLYISSPENLGGLGFRPREMSVLYTIRPIIGTIINILVYPPLARRFATEQLFKWGVALNSSLYYICNFAYGLFAYYCRPSHQLSIVVLSTFAVCHGIGGGTASAAVQTCSARAPNKDYLARLLTVQEYVATVGHGLGAITGSNVWVFSITHSLLHGQIFWLFMLSLAIILATLASRLTQKKGWKEIEEAEETTARAA